jgi:hypothetical protein
LPEHIKPGLHYGSHGLALERLLDELEVLAAIGAPELTEAQLNDLVKRYGSQWRVTLALAKDTLQKAYKANLPQS